MARSSVQTGSTKLAPILPVLVSARSSDGRNAMIKNSSLDRLVTFGPLMLAAGLLLGSCAAPTAEKPAAAPPPAEAAKAEAAPAEAPKAEPVAPEAPKPAAQAEAEAAKPQPPAAEAPKPEAPKPEAPKPEAPQPPAAVAGSSTELFEFDRAVLRPSEKQKLDSEVVARLATFANIEYINVNGHADRIGTVRYNQKLSERRAAAAKAYLVSRGIDGAKIETRGYGESMQVKSCPDDRNRKALIECLAPNRRVVVDIKGTPRL
jgi:OOP family OmpA-OmpF porin